MAIFARRAHWLAFANKNASQTIGIVFLRGVHNLSGQMHLGHGAAAG